MISFLLRLKQLTMRCLSPEYLQRWQRLASARDTDREPKKNAARRNAEREDAIATARADIEKFYRKQALQNATNMTSKKAAERAIVTYNEGDRVLTYRSNDGWTGPHLVADIPNDSDIVVRNTVTGRRAKLEESAVVNYIPVEDEHHASEISGNVRRLNGHSGSDIVIGNLPELFETTVIPPSPKNATRFAKPRRTELNGLLEANVFSLMRRCNVPENARVFKGRFVDAVKNAETTKEIEKSRYVWCGYNDKGKEELLTQAPTVTKRSVRILLNLAASLQARGYRAKIRDISQAYTQLHTYVSRSVMVEAPEELGLGSDYVLMVLRPLYGLAEAALHCYNTYAGHHEKDPGRQKTKLDMCLFLKRSSGMLDGVVALRVDDSLILETSESHQLEEEKAKSFLSTPPHEVDEGRSEMFNGADIRNGGDRYELGVDSKGKTLPTDVASENFVSRRALTAYLGLWCCPVHLGKVQLLAGVGNSSKLADIALLEKVLEEIKLGNRPSYFTSR